MVRSLRMPPRSSSISVYTTVPTGPVQRVGRGQTVEERQRAAPGDLQPLELVMS